VKLRTVYAIDLPWLLKSSFTARYSRAVLLQTAHDAKCAFFSADIHGT